MKLFFVFLVVLLVVASPSRAVNTRNRTLDEITTLPFWSPKPIPVKMYSGYLDNGAGGYLHYLWQFPQEGDPATADVVFASSGGPGCSSNCLSWYENGMFQLYFKTATTPPNASTPFFLNPYAWNRKVHMVYLTHPSGVAPAFGSTAESLDVDDRTDGARNFVALSNLFTYKFPEYKQNRFWLTGESYFGIYSMMLTEQILNYLDAGNLDLFQNFRGVMVGNGVTDDAYDDNLAYSLGLFAHGHGMITGDHYAQLVSDCIDTPYSDACNAQWGATLPSNVDIYFFTGWCYSPSDLGDHERQKKAEVAADTTGTKKMLSSDYRHFAGHFNGKTSNRRRRPQTSASNPRRSVAEKVAASSYSSSSAATGTDDPFASSYSPAEQQYMDENFPGFTPLFGTNFYDLDCTDETMANEYFSRNDVKMAFHLPLNFNFTICWNLPYKKVVTNVVPIYERLQKRPNTTIIIYNGIQDMAVPWTGTESWMENHGWQSLSSYIPWNYFDAARPEYGQQNGGWVMRIGAPNTYFVTIRTAGHMTPEVDNAPAASYEMFSRAVSGNLWDVPLFDSPRPFKGPFINPNPTPISASEKGKWIGVGVAICIGILVVVLIVVILVGRNKSENKSFSRQRHAEQGIPASESEYYNAHTS